MKLRQVRGCLGLGWPSGDRGVGDGGSAELGGGGEKMGSPPWSRLTDRQEGSSRNSGADNVRIGDEER
jgi:hypothetical protein